MGAFPTLRSRARVGGVSGAASLSRSWLASDVAVTDQPARD